MSMKWLIGTIIVYLGLSLDLRFVTAGEWKPEQCFAVSLPVFLFSAVFYVLCRKARRDMDESDRG